MTQNPLIAWADNPEILERYIRVPTGLRGYNIDFRESFQHYMNTRVAVTNCPTGRIAYLEATGVLRKDLRFKKAAEEGKLIHKVMELAFRHAVKGRMDATEFFNTARGFEVSTSTRDIAYKIYRNFYHIFSSIRTKSLAIVFVEERLSGNFMALSDVRFDLLVGNPPIVIDFKTGGVKKEHLLQVCAYAMAYEHHTNTDVNFGGIWSIEPSTGVNRLLLFSLDSKVRRALLERIAQKLHVLRNPEKDPGPDGKACEQCFWKKPCISNNNS